MMKQLSTLLAVACAAAVDAAALDVSNDVEFPARREVGSFEYRATPEAPHGYAPANVSCPSERPQVRVGSSLSSQELEWLPKRRNETIEHIKDFLKRNPIPDFDSDSYFDGVTANSSSLPNIGIAISGGGYRAMLNGAGAVAAFDSRSPNSTSKGQLGGLLQSSTYISGLSGGGWLVGSIYTNNFTSVHDAVNSNVIWQFNRSILHGPQGYSLLDYYQTILEDVDKKGDAGFNRSITDYWGRMLSFQLVNAKNGGPAYTFSSIADDPDFSDAKAPMPFLVADSRRPGEKNASINNTLFEISPWEIGSRDPTLNGFAPLKYTGSYFENGSIPDDKECVRGFDNAGYVMGTSSSLFNQILLYIKQDPSKYLPSDIPKFIVKLVLGVLTDLDSDENDIADWTPNPFRGWNPENNSAADSSRLTLIDGGEDGQNVPYHPHTVTDRKVDVVFSIDSSADTSSWPNGTSAVVTYERSLDPISNGTSFPVVPGRNTFVNLGLNTRPTFFGCNATNTTVPAPLIIYLPNYPYIYNSNISTFTLSIENDERDAMISNGWAVATQLNSTRDADWSTCVSCAMLQRSFERTKTKMPDKCNQCFERYCWNGTIDESEPKQQYQPALYSTPIEVNKDKDSFGVRLSASSTVSAAVAAIIGVAVTL